MAEAGSNENLFNALYPFSSGNLPRTTTGAVFTRSVFFMTSCRDQMSLNWQSGGPHHVHQQWLKTFNYWRRQAIGVVEEMESRLDKPQRKAKRFIRRPAKRERKPAEGLPALPSESLGESG